VSDWQAEAQRLKDEIRVAISAQHSLISKASGSDFLSSSGASEVAAGDLDDWKGEGRGEGRGEGSSERSISKLQEQIDSVHSYVAVTERKDRLIDDLREQLSYLLHSQSRWEQELKELRNGAKKAAINERRLQDTVESLQESLKTSDRNAASDRQTFEETRAQLQQRIQLQDEYSRRVEHDKEVHAAEAELARQETGVVSAEAASARQTLVEKEEEKRRADHLMGQLEQNSRSLQARSEALKEATEAAAVVKDENERLLKGLALANSQLQQLERRLGTSEEDKTTAEQQLAKLRAELKVVSHKHQESAKEAANNSVGSIEFDKLRSGLADAKQGKAQVEDQLASTRQQLAAARERETDLTRQLLTVEHHLGNARDELGQGHQQTELLLAQLAAADGPGLVPAAPTFPSAMAALRQKVELVLAERLQQRGAGNLLGDELAHEKSERLRLAEENEQLRAANREIELAAVEDRRAAADAQQTAMAELRELVRQVRHFKAWCLLQHGLIDLPGWPIKNGVCGRTAGRRRAGRQARAGRLWRKSGRSGRRRSNRSRQRSRNSLTRSACASRRTRHPRARLPRSAWPT
jgi:hypothetical protein